MKEGKTGVTKNTPKNILFGAGTIHKGLKYEGGKWNFEESIIGATSGGSKFTIKPEIVKVEADGALVAVKGLEKKTGETAEMEINFLELTKEIINELMELVPGEKSEEEKIIEIIKALKEMEKEEKEW